MSHEARITTTRDPIAAAATIEGSLETGKLERKKASRAAFPAVWKAIIKNAAAVANDAAEADREIRSIDRGELYFSDERVQNSSGHPTPL